MTRKYPISIESLNEHNIHSLTQQIGDAKYEITLQLHFWIFANAPLQIRAEEPDARPLHRRSKMNVNFVIYKLTESKSRLPFPLLTYSLTKNVESSQLAKQLHIRAYFFSEISSSVGMGINSSQFGNVYNVHIRVSVKCTFDCN